MVSGNQKNRMSVCFSFLVALAVCFALVFAKEDVTDAKWLQSTDDIQILAEVSDRLLFHINRLP